MSLFQHAANRPPSLPHRALLYKTVIWSGSFFTVGSELSDTWSYSLVICDSVSKCIDIFGEKSSALHLFPRKFPSWHDWLCFLLSSAKSHSSRVFFFPLTALAWHISLQLKADTKNRYVFNHHAVNKNMLITQYFLNFRTAAFNTQDDAQRGTSAARTVKE